MDNVIRFGVSIEPELLSKFDKLIDGKGYENRSEAIRDMMRRYLADTWSESDDNMVVGSLTIKYGHHVANITEKLTSLQHDHHSTIHCTTHVHLDSDECLEVLVVSGHAGDVRMLADSIGALKGVSHSRLVMTNPE